jgi:hypothetical protein
MERIKLNDLMGLERLLLEIDIRYKFDLSFNDAYLLYEYLKNVGRITSYFFLIQDEFYQKYNDKDKLKEYHDRLLNDSLEFNYNGIVEFIDRVSLTNNDDDEFKTLVNKIKFWQ